MELKELMNAAPKIVSRELLARRLSNRAEKLIEGGKRGISRCRRRVLLEHLRSHRAFSSNDGLAMRSALEHMRRT